MHLTFFLGLLPLDHIDGVGVELGDGPPLDASVRHGLEGQRHYGKLLSSQIPVTIRNIMVSKEQPCIKM